jgi:OPA family glycerol-3-phosphate transporter-like MFS transporter/OPA family sugar phosphate sensor protein UhpC-like MFS transporter
VCAVHTLLFLLEWTSSHPNILLSAALLAGADFSFTAQALIGISAANIATKKAAASASGLTGTFGYASGLISGVFLGWLMDFGGDRGTVYVLTAFTLLALVGMGCFCWPGPRLRTGMSGSGESSCSGQRTR